MVIHADVNGELVNWILKYDIKVQGYWIEKQTVFTFVTFQQLMNSVNQRPPTLNSHLDEVNVWTNETYQMEPGCFPYPFIQHPNNTTPCIYNELHI